MRKYFYYFICFFYSSISISQTYSITYSEKIVLDFADMNILPEDIKEDKINRSLNLPDLYTLIYSNGISLYKNLKKEQNINNSSSIELNSTFKNNTDKYFFKDIHDGVMTFKLNIGNETFYGKDSFLPMDWKITTEKSIINNYNCTKATSNWNGYRYTAWFTQDIPINVGPEKFNGLPGLIVKVIAGQTEINLEDLITYKETQKIVKPEITQKTYTVLELDQHIKNKIGSYEKIGKSTLIIRNKQ